MISCEERDRQEEDYVSEADRKTDKRWGGRRRGNPRACESYGGRGEIRAWKNRQGGSRDKKRMD